jgi:hypothetical protein
MSGALPAAAEPRAGAGRELLVLAAIAALGVAVHLWFALGADALDTDRALVLLMARHFAAGDLAVYFWQQNYMGALEPLLLAPLAAVGAATPLAASLVAIAITAALAGLSVTLARRVGGVVWLALLFWAIPPAVVVHHHVALYGARLTATLLALGSLLVALRARRPAGCVAAGVLAGVAYFGDHLMIGWSLGVMWVAARRGGLRAFALGALPIVALDTLAAVLTPAIHLAGPNDPSSWLTNVPLLLGATLPQLFGLLLGRGPGPLFEPAASLVPRGGVWLLFALPGAIVGGALIATGARRWRALRGDVHDRAATERALILEALLLAVAATLALFTLVGGGGDRWPVRYLVPLWPAISVLAAAAASGWPARLRPLAAAALLPAVFTLYADRSWPRAGDAPAARAEAVAVREAVARAGVRAVWADYWDTYRMALHAGESPPWVTLRIIQRRPEQASAAERAERVGYLLRIGDREIADSLARAEQRGAVDVVAQTDVGRYRLIVTDRAAPGLVLITSNPTRGWQRLAAAAAGGLFVGALLAIALLERWRRGRAGGGGAAGPQAPGATGGTRAGAAPSRSSAASR